MNNVLSEKDYQKFLLERLADNGYVIRKASHFDRLFAMDREMLMKFLADTQPDTMDYLRKIYKDDLEDTIVSFINAETTKARGSLIDVLKHGIEISNRQLDLMYTKPATTFNPELTKKYGQNIFSVMEEVWASDKERIDVVIFLNGLAIISFELKCNTAGQSYQDAIYQYRTERNPKTRLFLFKSGCLVNFAMDLEEVYMTTKLAGEATFFLPFNMGNGEGVTAGAAGGNGLPESGPVDGVDAVGEQVDGKDPGNQKEEKGVEDSLWDGKGGGVLQDGFHEGEKDGQNDHRQDKKANDFGEQGDEVVGDKRGVVRNHRLIPSLSCLGRARLWNDEDSVVEPWNGLQPVCKAVCPGAKRHAVLCRRGVRPAKEGE